MWLLLDNYDSFTHILHHYLLKMNPDCVVKRNNEITTAEIQKINPERIIISPGPERPQHAGILMELVEKFYNKIPLLGICLGHQAIGEFFGAKLVHAPTPQHGKIWPCQHFGHEIFKDIPASFEAMRYHSLCLTDLPEQLKILARSNDGVVQATAHEFYPCIGLQFHPESIGTKAGMTMIKNWAEMNFDVA